MITVETITFPVEGKEYTEKALEDMGGKELLSFRNVVASNLGMRDIKSFHTHAKGVASTWKLLQEWNAQGNIEDAIEEDGGPKRPAPTPVAPGRQPKCAVAREIKRPNAKMFRTIKKLAKEPVKGLRPKRWDRYENGMTLKLIAETEGMDVRDIMFYVSNELMELVEPTKKALAEAGITKKED